MSVLPGSDLEGRFALESIAAGGGMAIVYRARDNDTGLLVAIKVARDITLDPTMLQRFEQEVGVLQKLVYPAIARLVGPGTTEDGAPYLAMEWLVGEELQKKLRRERLEFDDAIALGKTLASALEAAHAVDIFHRDVKPANVILVDGDPTGAPERPLAYCSSRAPTRSTSARMTERYPYSGLCTFFDSLAQIDPTMP